MTSYPHDNAKMSLRAQAESNGDQPLSKFLKREKLLIVRRKETGRHRGETFTRNHYLEIISVDDVSVKQYRSWKNRDDVTVDEISSYELWTRIHDKEIMDWVHEDE